MCPGLKQILLVIYVKTAQKSCVEYFFKVPSVRNVYPVLVLVGNVVRVVNNHQHSLLHWKILQILGSTKITHLRTQEIVNNPLFTFEFWHMHS